MFNSCVEYSMYLLSVTLPVYANRTSNNKVDIRKMRIVQIKTLFGNTKSF